MRRLAILSSVLLCAGCAEPWVQARSTVAATGAVVDVLDGETVRGLIPESAREDYDIAITAGRGVVDVGGDVVDAWQQSREEPRGWEWWAQKALRWAASILDVIKGCGVDVPDAVGLAVGGLQLLLPVVAGSLGG